MGVVEETVAIVPLPIYSMIAMPVGQQERRLPFRQQTQPSLGPKGV